MPPKGSSKIDLPEWVEKRHDGQVRCLLCDPPGLDDDSKGWMQRSSLAKHFTTARHKDALAVEAAHAKRAAVAEVQASGSVPLNPLPVSEPPSLPSAPWTAMDLGHIDTNGVEMRDYMDANFSAGDDEKEARLARSKEILDAYGVEEISPDESEAPEDDSLSTLPRQILASLAAEDLDMEEIQEKFMHIVRTGDWSPYPNKTLFFLDLMDNIPRLRLSNEHMRFMFWIMEQIGAKDMPKLYSFRQMQKNLQENCSVKSHQYRSTRGNVFDMVDVPQQLGRDVSNPLISPHLVWYPEVPDGPVSEAWHTKKWHEQIPLDQLTPMYADGGKMYYVNELSRLHDGRFVIPERWITRGGILTADCRIAVWTKGTTPDDMAGFCVEDSIQHIPSSLFASNYLDLVEHLQIGQYRFKHEFQTYRDHMPNPLRDLADDSEAILSCFIKPWCDDVSGGRSKQYQPHNNIYMANGNLPGKLLNQEFFIRFVSTATHASSLEQFAALKQQLDANNKNPIRVYDATTGRYVRLRIYILNLPADNPAQAAEASHIGGNGNYPCRKCDVGGPYAHTETIDGYKSFYKPGNSRTVDETINIIRQQIETACYGVEDHVTHIQTRTGVKDRTAQDIITELIKRGREIKAAIKKSGHTVTDDAVMQKQVEWLNTQSPEPFNVLFQIHGLDPHRDTPVEILHTILLGVEKYVWHTVHTTIKDSDHCIFETRLQDSNVDALDADPVRANYFMRFKNNLIGRQFRTIMQLTAFHIHDIAPPGLFSLVKSVGMLGAMLWYSEIDDMDLYLGDLDILVNNVLDSFALLDPARIIVKMKLHILTHLVDDIRNHGPAVRYSTEVFECFNGVFRMCSILSNHQAPSRDICLKMLELERFQHIASGGFWDTSTGPACASNQIQHLIRTNIKLQSHLGWVAPHKVSAGVVKLVPVTQRRALKWSETCGHSVSLENDFYLSQTWYECINILSSSGDECTVGFWVVAQLDKDTIIGRIQQILRSVQTSDQALVILELFELAETLHSALDMPVLRKTDDHINVRIVRSMDVLFAFNTQHDCKTLSCSASSVQAVRQERLNTTIERSAIAHAPEQIFVINMHSLHNARRLRAVLPRSLTKPLRLRNPEERKQFLTETAKQHQQVQLGKREEQAKKREVAREKRKEREKEKGKDGVGADVKKQKK